MRRVLVFVPLLLAFAPSAAHAATCSSYSNQAAAQRAADTRDADGDGIYCESLPCPCAGKTSSTGDGGPLTPVHHTTPVRTGRPKVGPPVALGRRTKRTGCRVRGPLPDPRCTPGSRFKLATPRVFCVSGYTAKVRDVSESTKDRVFASYGITAHSGKTYEVDHLVPLELGGSNSIANLFPEAASPAPGFHQKDKLENRTHARACSGIGKWRAAQRATAKNWLALYKQLGL